MATLASSDSASLPPAQELFQSLVRLAIRRCLASGNVCRVSALVRCILGSRPLPSVRMSISDTGIKSHMDEFQGIDRILRDATNWDGVLSVTTTGIADEYIDQYCLKLWEAESTARITRLSSKEKHGKSFSGTEVSLSIGVDESLDEFVDCAHRFIKKMRVLKAQTVAVELTVENVTAGEVMQQSIAHSADGILLPLSMSSINRLTSGLQEYVLKHGSTLDEECLSCFTSSNSLKVGNGIVNCKDNHKSEATVEAAIVFANVTDKSFLSCTHAFTTTTEVLYFEDFSPISMPMPAIDSLKRFAWKDYGLILKSGTVNGYGQFCLEWENFTPCTVLSIAVHCYCSQFNGTKKGQMTRTIRHSLMKAVKLAFIDLKTRHPGSFLSYPASQIRGYIPDLSRTISSLILSSRDLDFQAECASLLGMQLLDISTGRKIESCIEQKIVRVIEMNDTKVKRKRQDDVPLFECDTFHEDSGSDGIQEENGEDDEHQLEFQFV